MPASHAARLYPGFDGGWFRASGRRGRQGGDRRAAPGSGSSCAKTGSQIGSSNPSTTSSTTAARLGTSSSINPGGSCPSECATGPTGPNQRVLVLPAGGCVERQVPAGQWLASLGR